MKKGKLRGALIRALGGYETQHSDLRPLFRDSGICATSNLTFVDFEQLTVEINPEGMPLIAFHSDAMKQALRTALFESVARGDWIQYDCNFGGINGEPVFRARLFVGIEEGKNKNKKEPTIYDLRKTEGEESADDRRSTGGQVE